MYFHGKDIKIFSANSNKAVAAQIATHLGLPEGKCEVGRFSDGEIAVSILESVRGSDVYVIQSTCAPVNDNLMELLIMIDAFKRASAARITAVIPYFGYARQDRKARARDPISAKLVADLIVTAGANRILTMDLHAPQIQGFFNIPVDHLLGVPLLAPYFREKAKQTGEEFVIVSPDAGSAKRARNFGTRLDVPIAIIDKRRPKANVSEVMNIIGEVKDRTCVIVDDIVDTAGTLCKAATALKENGARRVLAYCTHPVLSNHAAQRIAESDLDELVVTDTIPLSEESRACGRIRQVSVASLLADTMLRISNEESVSSLFQE